MKTLKKMIEKEMQSSVHKRPEVSVSGHWRYIASQRKRR